MTLPLLDALTTRRLVLRPVAEADLDDLLAVNGDPEVTRFLPYDTWRGQDDARAWLARMRALEAGGRAQQLVLALAEPSRVVGSLLLFNHDPPSARLEIGYVLGRAHWRRGLMAEALQAYGDHAFGAAGLRRLEAEVNPANKASCRLMRRLGFVHEGTLRQRWVAKGAAYDTLFFGCLAEDWARRPAAG